MAEPTLEKMVSLIRAQPAITVRELARQLGFAEERSVYYWLRKAGHRGLKTFKREVLWGRYPAEPPAPGGEEVSKSKAADESAQDVREEAPLYAAHVLTVATRAYEPWVRAGDELHVDPRAMPASGDLVVVDLPGEPDALRRCYPHPVEILLTHPGNPRESIRLGGAGVTLKGVVVRLVRRRP